MTADRDEALDMDLAALRQTLPLVEASGSNTITVSVSLLRRLYDAALATPAQPAPEPSEVCPHCGALYADEAEMRCSSCGQSAATPAQPALDVDDLMRSTAEASRDRAIEAVEDSTSRLVLAFRRWCVRRGVEPPSVDEYRAILDEAARLQGQPET